MKLRQLDRRFLAREDEPEDIEVARTNGCYVYDERGRRYIDFLVGVVRRQLRVAQPRDHENAAPQAA